VSLEVLITSLRHLWPSFDIEAPFMACCGEGLYLGYAGAQLLEIRGGGILGVSGKLFLEGAWGVQKI
jgi:hypothetical protein